MKELIVKIQYDLDPPLSVEAISAIINDFAPCTVTSLRLDGDKDWEKIESDFKKRFISPDDSLHYIEGAMSVFDWIKKYFGSLSSDEKGVTGLQSEWVRVEKELPKKITHVLITDGQNVNVGYLAANKWFTLSDNELPITHWQPLPSPPINKF